MNFSKMAKGVADFVDSAMNKVIDKTEAVDEAVTRRKTLRNIKDEFSEVATDLIEKLVSLDEEDIQKLPEEVKSDVLKLIQAIDVMDELEEEMLAESGYKSCVECGEVIDEDANFCSECGADQEIVDDLPAEEIVYDVKKVAYEVMEDSEDDVKETE